MDIRLTNAPVLNGLRIVLKDLETVPSVFILSFRFSLSSLCRNSQHKLMREFYNDKTPSSKAVIEIYICDI